VSLGLRYCLLQNFSPASAPKSRPLGTRGGGGGRLPATSPAAPRRGLPRPAAARARRRPRNNSEHELEINLQLSEDWPVFRLFKLTFHVGPFDSPASTNTKVQKLQRHSWQESLTRIPYHLEPV